MATRALVVLSLVASFCADLTRSQGSFLDTFPQSEYEYSLRRDYLLDKEAEMAGNDIVLTEDERIVDNYLNYLKLEHFQDTKATGFPPARPLEENIAIIRNSQVYKILSRIPKGGNMHTHENHELSKEVLLDIVWNSADFENLYILPENSSTPYILDYFINPPSNEWEKVQGNSYYTRERILNNVHLIGILTADSKKYPSDSEKRWDQMNTIWDRFSHQIIANINIKKQHMLALYRQALDEGVQYLETRKRFRYGERLYELDPDPAYAETNGKRYLDTTGELDINITLEALGEFMADNPEFIGHNRITYATRFSDREMIQSDMNNALLLNEKYPNHMRGFDLVAEEDNGNSHVFFLDNFLTLYNDATQRSKIDLFLHTAETSFPEDIITAANNKDYVATAENAFDAIVLGAKRVGHGLAYIKFPFLMQQLKERQIGVEICPASNQVLGLIADLRDHPAVNYMRMGIPVLLGSDDPSSFGFDNITIDWYEAFMAWGLTIKDLKQLAINNLNYSAMTDTEKQDAINNKFLPYWNTQIASIREDACALNLNQNQPQFAGILPKDGAITGSTRVHIFGRYFEGAVCQTVRCRFGQTESTEVYYVSRDHIICASPEGSGDVQTVNVQISLDGSSFLDTGYNFTYNQVEQTPPITGVASSHGINVQISIALLFIAFLM